ncbi:MAG: flagellar biosynthesis anti-sigma factor FlgM [Rhodocyclales bacterium]|nr:flagellar biosynthesis anti-sigma factor FlgM [Rhodocyclales bacterium]
MKIDSSIPSPAVPSKARPQTAASTAGTASAASDASVATHLQQAGALASATAPFDSKRVAEIRQAIAEGRFRIDAHKIADRLIDGVRELLGKNRPPA